MGRRTLVIVTGMSGAGKTQVIRTLEDSGFYCVDNLPLGLFAKFLDLLELEGAGEELGSLVAMGLDLREGGLDQRFPAIYDALKRSPHDVRIWFVDADDEIILRRFVETRRPHPLAPKGTVEEGVELERKRLADIREKADWIIDTSTLTIHDTREQVRRAVTRLAEARPLTVNVVSFGFAYGLPPEASMVFDVRFLPNPHFVPEMRALTGESDTVYRYVCKSDEGREFLEHTKQYVDYLVPQFQREGKAYLTLAVGCTGGKHRSVAVARWLHEHLSNRTDIMLNLLHRDHER
ncbi:MAG: RNase adapter RapZ [Acidobacteriota bacterium]